MTDERIVGLMYGGDERGLDEAVSKYGRLVRSIAAGMLGSKEDQEEVVSDTFYKVWRNRADIDLNKGSLKAYVCTVARSCTLDKLRTLTCTEPLPEEERDLGVEADFSTESSAEHNRRLIAECIRSLPSPDREVFIFRFYYSLSYAEIAARTDIPESKIRSLLQRSKRRLRQALIKGGILL